MDEGKTVIDHGAPQASEESEPAAPNAPEAPDAPDAPRGPGRENASARELAAVNAMMEDLARRLAQAQAEVENVQRRAQEDIARTRKYAIEPFVREVLHVKDALETAQRLETEDSEALRAGLELCLRRLDAALARRDW